MLDANDRLGYTHKDTARQASSAGSGDDVMFNRDADAVRVGRHP